MDADAASELERFWGRVEAVAAGTAQWTEGDAFSGVLSSFGWSSTTFAVFPGNAWVVNLSVGSTIGADGGNTNLAWPVRGGQ
ncbi:MAG: hypothetical protein ACREOH_09965 [Candidatus Entotheonellia bacterium]